jgi:hypothetical protein
LERDETGGLNTVFKGEYGNSSFSFLFLLPFFLISPLPLSNQIFNYYKPSVFQFSQGLAKLYLALQNLHPSSVIGHASIQQLLSIALKQETSHWLLE